MNFDHMTTEQLRTLAIECGIWVRMEFPADDADDYETWTFGNIGSTLGLDGIEAWPQLETSPEHQALIAALRTIGVTL